MQNLCQNAPVVCTVSVAETVGFYLLAARMQLHLWCHSIGNIARNAPLHLANHKIIISGRLPI